MKKLIPAILFVGVVLTLCACSVTKQKTEKLRDIDFTVVGQREIPEEFLEHIEEKEEYPLKMTYADEGILYIAVGYGEQETSGYSIEVNELYETPNAIYIQTNLIGPSADEKISKRKTYPYVVVKMEYLEKNVVFK